MELEAQAYEELCHVIRQQYHVLTNFYQTQFADLAICDLAPYNLETFQSGFDYCLSKIIGETENIKKNEKKESTEGKTVKIDAYLATQKKENRKNTKKKNAQTSSNSNLPQKKSLCKRRIKSKTEKLCNMIENKEESYVLSVESFFKQYQNPQILSLLVKTKDINTYFSMMNEAHISWKKEGKTLLEHPYVLSPVFCNLKSKIDYYYEYLEYYIIEQLQTHKPSFFNYSTAHAESILDKPWFGAKNKKIPQNQITHETLDGEDVISYELAPNNSILINSIISRKSYSTLGEKDFKILGSLINNAYSNFPNFIEKNTVNTTVNELAQVITNNPKPNGTAYQNVIERLEYISRINFREYNSESNSTLMYNLLDNVKIDHDTGSIEVQFGSIICQNIMDAKLVFVTKKALLSLSNPLASRMLPILQRERVYIYTKDPEQKELIKRYDYNFFSSKFLFSSKSAKKNLETLREIFQEMLENKLILDEFKIDLKYNVVYIHYIPLSAQEIEDINFHKTKLNIPKENIDAKYTENMIKTE